MTDSGKNGDSPNFLQKIRAVPVFPILATRTRTDVYQVAC
jgi:hypothetical protein